MINIFIGFFVLRRLKSSMNSQVTDRELTFILLASMLTILIILFIVGKWLNFHLFTCCFNRTRNRKPSTNVSSREGFTQVNLQ